MWYRDDFEILEFSLRGKDYDARVFGVISIKPPTADSACWEIDFEDGTKLITTDMITIRLWKKNRG